MKKTTKKVCSSAVLALGLASLPLLSGCAVAAMTATGVVVADELQGKVLVATVEEEADVVWASAKSSLAHMTDALLHVDEDHRQAQTRVDNAVITVSVRTENLDETQVRITAKKYLLWNQEIAEIVQRRIVKDLGRD